jgi:hypothetical protein
MRWAGRALLGALLVCSGCDGWRCGSPNAPEPTVPTAPASPPLLPAPPATPPAPAPDTAAPHPLAAVATGSTASADGPLDAGEAERVQAVLDLSADDGDLGALIRAAHEDPSPAVREAAVVALGDSDESRAVDALIAATEDPERSVVLAAIEQLAWSEDHQARETLERLSRSGDTEIAASAKDALEE